MNGCSRPIAIVRPSNKSEAKIREEGPQIIQADKDNHASTSLKEGFNRHRAAFRDGQIPFFAHSIPAKAAKADAAPTFDIKTKKATIADSAQNSE